jgi:hypothetical protein
LQSSGVQGVVREDETLALFVGEPAFDEGEIQVGVAAIYFVADDGVAEVGEVNADLMFAAGVGAQAEKGEI